jgi:spore germination cell wall hydrolase CwlJ-like protein
MIEEENKSRIATNIYSNENESEIFANSSQIESEMTNSFVDDNSNNQIIFDSEEEFNAISSEEKNLDQRHMMTKALSTKNNSVEDFVMKISSEEEQNASNQIYQMTSNAHVTATEHNASLKRSSISRESNSSDQLTEEKFISTHHIRDLSSSDQLIAKNSSSAHHIENNETFSETNYESAEK